MEPTQNNTVRSLLLFFIIGVLLLAAVILGVRWARGRSDQIASSNSQPAVQQPTEQQTQEQKQPEPQPATSAPSPQPTTGLNKPATAPVASSTPSHVPATGIEDAILPIVALAATVFAASTYAQSRRRLVQFK